MIDLRLKDILGMESFVNESDEYFIGKFEFKIAGKTHIMKFFLNGGAFAKCGFLTGAMSGFNKFIANSTANLQQGLKVHRGDLYDYLDPKVCAQDGLPEPNFNNFAKLVKFTTVIFGKTYGKGGMYTGPEYCAICGEMPWDQEHGVGIIINSAGTVTHMANFMDAFGYNV